MWQGRFLCDQRAWKTAKYLEGSSQLTMNDDYRLLIFASLAIFLWGLWGFFGKLALGKGMQPVTIFVAEAFMSCLCAIPLSLYFYYNHGTYIHSVSWNVFGLLSGTGLAIGLLFYYLALEKGNMSIIVPLTSIYPVVSVLLGYLVLGEKMRLPQWLGVILIIAGTVLVLSGPVNEWSHSNKDISVKTTSK